MRPPAAGTEGGWFLPPGAVGRDRCRGGGLHCRVVRERGSRAVRGEELFLGGADLGLLPGVREPLGDAEGAGRVGDGFSEVPDSCRDGADDPWWIIETAGTGHCLDVVFERACREESPVAGVVLGKRRDPRKAERRPGRC
jgi:hypothetical protein